MVDFYSEFEDLELLRYESLKKFFQHLASSYEVSILHLQYIFTTDKKILEVNKEFLNHDYYTDIITFNYGSKNILKGDIYISVETVSSNAKQFGESYEEELLRVIFHGFLHLVGFNDKTLEEQSLMSKEENKCLEMYATFSD